MNFGEGKIKVKFELPKKNENKNVDSSFSELISIILYEFKLHMYFCIFEDDTKFSDFLVLVLYQTRSNDSKRKICA